MEPKPFIKQFGIGFGVDGENAAPGIGRHGNRYRPYRGQHGSTNVPSFIFLVCGEPGDLDRRIIGVCIPILVVFGINILLDDAVVEEREVSYTFPRVHGEIRDGYMGILVFQCIGGQVVGQFLVCAGK